jgi:chromosomal replication initiator protein
MHKTITDEHTTAHTQVVSISQTLAQRIGPDKYRVWFGGTPNMVLADGCLKITVPNTFTANWIQTHYLDRITAIAESVLGYRPKIGFSIIPPLAQKGPKATPGHRLSDSQKASQQGHGVRPPREVRLTLESFVVGPSNELAFNAAKAVIREGHSPFNPLFIHGGYGVGKTHLLQGICHELAQIRPQSSWLYLSAEDFANQFIMALKNKKLEDFRRRIRQLDLLAIDDIHFLANKPSTQEEFFHTFNTISLAGKQVVLASDASPKMIKQLSEKIINRFVSGMVVRIDPPDLATRCRICNQYVQRVTNPMSGAKGASHPVPEIVIRFVAENVRANVRELEGALLRVMAFASLQSGPVTLETAKQALADPVERPDTAVLQVSHVESAVAAYFGVNPAAIQSSRKDRTVSLARHFCMYLARKHTRLSCVELGKQMGNKNHATIIMACKKIEDLVIRNAELHWQGPAGNKIAQAKSVLTDIESRLIR